MQFNVPRVCSCFTPKRSDQLTKSIIQGDAYTPPAMIHVASPSLHMPRVALPFAGIDVVCPNICKRVQEAACLIDSGPLTIVLNSTNAMPDSEGVYVRNILPPTQLSSIINSVAK